MDSPFLNAPRVIVHCAHHKMGTRWFTKVLRSIADHYGLEVQQHTPSLGAPRRVAAVAAELKFRVRRVVCRPEVWIGDWIHAGLARGQWRYQDQ